VLKGPLIGFDEDCLFRLAHERGDGVTLWTELRRRRGEDEAFAGAGTVLQELLARVDYAPPYELIAEILGARGGRRKWLARLGPEAGDPLDELMAASLAYERQHGTSLQGFLHWLGTGDIEVKRDFDLSGRDEVRIMTVHGAKGLQAPIVFLPDTMGVPPPQAPSVLWTEDGLPLWRAHAGCGAPALDRARALAQQKKDEEYRRLLYVAMTRAEDRLYVCGWHGKRAPPPDCWYGLVEAGLESAPGVVESSFAAPIADGWEGKSLALVTLQSVPPEADTRAIAGRPGPLALPDWCRSPPKPEPSPPKPLAPSRPERAEPAPRSPLGDDGGAGFRRGLLVHRLLQTLPQLDPGARGAAARRFLALPVHELEPDEQKALLAETLAVLDDPETAPLFGPGSLAEVPVVGVIGGRVLSGRIDRLVVTDEAVLIVDYKTLRPVPADEDRIPALYIDQLRAYRAAVAQVYPGRAVRCALLWTDGPTLMQVSQRRLAIDARGERF
jgi:ATP-dependent helicase/nuclease subunit A